jgi:hypothetical protein
MKKIVLTEQQEHDLALIMEETGMSRKSALRKLQRRAKLAAKSQPKTAKTAKPVVKSQPTTEAGAARSAGVKDYILAGRPTREQFVAVFGPSGPKLTWSQRAALGVDAAHFQRALKSGKCVAPAAKSTGAVA